MCKPATHLPQARPESHDHHRYRDQPAEPQQPASESASRDIAWERLRIRDQRRAAHLGDCDASARLLRLAFISRQVDQVEAGERTVELLHLPAPAQGAEIDGEESSVLEQRDYLGVDIDVVT
jgi:hypothetical protein